MEQFIKDIRENYRKLEHELVTQLSYEVEHNVTTGTNREEIWVDFFRRIIPKKFNIARSVFIIDSVGGCSKEIDIAIYDEQYTPYIFNYGSIKFIPIEAVAAVVQCKSKQLKSKKLLEWTKSITELKTSKDSIVRLATDIHIGNSSSNKSIQTATTPIKILCYISKSKTAHKKNEAKDSFDIVIEAYQKEIKKEDKVKNNKSQDVSNEKEKSQYLGNLNIVFKNDENLYNILCRYNRADIAEEKVCDDIKKRELEQRKLSAYVVKDGTKEYSLLSFIFQFNQMLMLINNPMFFPHKAYVDMFQGTESK